MEIKEKFQKIIWTIFEKDGYSNDYKDRLELELKEIDNQNEEEYFFDLFKNSIKFSKNENNLFVAKLLRLTDDFNIGELPPYVQGEWPDIDVDYIDEVRDYLKNVWAPATFGGDRVCNIGNYTTFGIKSTLIDMTRVHGESRDEILALTTKIGLKDDEGKAFTFDKCLEIFPELADFCKRFPDISNAAQRLVNRNRGRGKHAGGLVVSSVPIDNFVPLVVDSDGLPASAWVEGLADQDLQQVGLIKFDLLVIRDLYRIAYCVKLIKERHGLEKFMALPGQCDWSDDSFLNDPKSLALADQAKLKGVFQFDSAGIRELVRSGGVTSFNDMVAYNAMFRPGPLGVSTDLYIERKRGRQQYELHSLLEPILQKTYGVMVFQEQVMRILNVVGKIPLKDCEAVRKAISKKKEKIIKKYEPMFLDNGQKTLQATLVEVQQMWADVMKFSGYGFNKSHALAYTVIAMQLLYLKAHYPLEFFAAALKTKKEDVKIKEYKQEAERYDIKINKIDLNKSGVNFQIIDNEIYMGFSNIKGIGKEVAQRIVDNQPYDSLEHFLEKFGTDASVVKPLIALRLFGDNVLHLYEFYEKYKKVIKSREDRDKRRVVTNYKTYETVSSMVLEGTGFKMDGEKLCDNFIAGRELDIPEGMPKESLKELHKILKRHKNSIENHAKKLSEDENVSMKDFRAKGKFEDEKILPILREIPQVAEIQYFGFGWNHFMEKSPDYDGDKTLTQFDEDEDLLGAYVEVQIVSKPVEKQFKSGKGSFYSVKIEDSSWNQANLTIWKEDYERFRPEFEYWESDSRKGNLVKMLVRRPQAGFSTYTFESPPRRDRWKLVPKNKEDDMRLIVMRRPND